MASLTGWLTTPQLTNCLRNPSKNFGRSSRMPCFMSSNTFWGTPSGLSSVLSMNGATELMNTTLLSRSVP